MDILFLDHKFKENNYRNFKSAVKKRRTAAECFDRHFSKEESAINSQRSNICADRVIKSGTRHTEP